MTNDKLKRLIPFSLVLLFIIGWTILLILKSPSEIVSFFGVENSYLIAFSISAMGAFSSFTTFSTYPAIVTLAEGNIDPFILGAVAGAGLSLGDILFFYFGFTIREVSGKKFREKLRRWLEKLEKKPEIYIQLFIYFYVGFTPFPNNVLTGMLSLTGYPFKKVVFPLVLGDISLPMLVAYLVTSGVDISKIFS